MVYDVQKINFIGSYFKGEIHQLKALQTIPIGNYAR